MLWLDWLTLHGGGKGGGAAARRQTIAARLDSISELAAHHKQHYPAQVAADG
jgi:hypothetical protein